MKVYWTENAIRHLLHIHEFIAQDSPFYANITIEGILEKEEQIGRFPESGRTVPEYQAKEIQEIIEKPYRIIYRIGDAQIDVLAVIHTSQELSNLL